MPGAARIQMMHIYWLKINSIILLLILPLFMAGCSSDVTYIQSIDINVYPDNERNVKLVEDLLYYDPKYIAFNVPSLNEETAPGIRLGYFIRSSDGKPSYRITYSLKVPAVAENIDRLKSDFEIFVAKLAASHAAKEAIFQALAPEGQKWVDSLLNSPASDTLAMSSPLLREMATEEQLSDFIARISDEYGVPDSVSFLRGLYYEEFEKTPESVSLHYMQNYSKARKLMIIVNMHEQGENWAVMGFQVLPQA